MASTAERNANRGTDADRTGSNGTRTKVIQFSFAGGEVSEAMTGRIDDAKYAQGLETCLNMICLPQGPVENRPGFEYVAEVADSSTKWRLIPFVFNAEQAVIIALGDKRARFYAFGQIIVDDDGDPYEIETPWSADDIFDLHYVQSADVMTVVHIDYPPKEIRRYGTTDWRIAEVESGAKLAAPETCTAERITEAADDDNSEKYKFQYAASALNADKSAESEATKSEEVVANLYAYGTTVEISCSEVEGASFYRFYKKEAGLYGYLGDSETPSIVDDNIAPDTGVTPRRYDDPFDDDGVASYPGAVGYYEQRRVFAGFSQDPQGVVMSRSGTEDDFSYSLPTQDEDRIDASVVTQQFNIIRHVVPLAQMLLLTSGSEIRITPINSDALTPSSFSARPQSYVGASNVQPCVVGSNTLYCAARGGHIMELSYQYNSGGYVVSDICLRAPHLFDYKTIADMTFSKAPIPILWCVSSSGELLGLTYVPDQSVGAWHRHQTDGVFESCACIPEDDEDRLYCVIKREVNGKTVRFVERMASRQFENLEDAFFVDCGGTYDGDETEEVSGITWLEGKTVAILADGAVVPEQVVVDGKITLPAPASKVHVGLPYCSNVKTLPVAFQGVAGYGAGLMKASVKAYLRVYRTSGLFAGPDFDSLAEYKQRTTEQPGFAPELVSGELKLQQYPKWTDSGAVCVRQSDPLPLELLSLTLDVTL